MKGSDAFPSNFLKASDLQGKDCTVTIDKVVEEQVGRQAGETKPVMYFVGKERGMVLNKTNWNAIAKITSSDDSDHWHGQKITIFATQCDFQGEQVECIRVRIGVAKSAAAPVSRPAPAPQRTAEGGAGEQPTHEDVPF